MSGNLLLCPRDWINNNFISSREKSSSSSLSDVYIRVPTKVSSIGWKSWTRVFLSFFVKRKTFYFWFDHVSRDEGAINDRGWSKGKSFVPFHGFRFASFNWISNPTDIESTAAWIIGPSLTFHVPWLRRTMTFFSDQGKGLSIRNDRSSSLNSKEVKRRKKKKEERNFEKKNGIVKRIFNDISSFCLSLFKSFVITSRNHVAILRRDNIKEE